MGATEILVSGGVAALLAAIVGGGLKAFGVELPLLASVRRQALLLVAGAALVGLGLYDARPRAGGSAPVGATAERPTATPLATGPDHRAAAAVAARPAGDRPEVPNIVGLPFPAGRQFLIQNGWAPINSPSSPMANGDLGLRGPEVMQAGYFEAVACSGSGMAPCLFRYRNPAGYILEVVAVGEDLKQAIVNRAVVLDCAADPKPEGCAA